MVSLNFPTWHLIHKLDDESNIVPTSHAGVGVGVGADEGKKHSKELVELEHVNEPSHEYCSGGQSSQPPFKRFAGYESRIVDPIVATDERPNPLLKLPFMHRLSVFMSA